MILDPQPLVGNHQRVMTFGCDHILASQFLLRVVAPHRSVPLRLKSLLKEVILLLLAHDRLLFDLLTVF